MTTNELRDFDIAREESIGTRAEHVRKTRTL
jgi:hypothetical protein